MTLSLAFSKSSISTSFLLSLAANSAASLTRFAKSAPENPGVPRASTFGLTSSANGNLVMCTLNICSQPRMSGNETTTCLSKRPGRSNAGSKTSGRLVAAITITPSLPSKPSISTSNWFKVCSRSSWPPPRPAPRCRPTASISSIKIIQGACFLAWSNISRTREAPTPTNISTKSEPEMVKKGTLASPATALANNVLPVPGGPTNNTPRGIFPPNRWNLLGSFRNSTSSLTSSLASSIPATSAKVICTWSSPSNRARLRPKESAPRPPPPPCIWRIKNTQTAMSSNIGNQLIKICINKPCCSGGWPLILTPFLYKVTKSSGSCRGMKVENGLSFWVTPRMFWFSIITELTLPCWTCRRNSL